MLYDLIRPLKYFRNHGELWDIIEVVTVECIGRKEYSSQAFRFEASIPSKRNIYNQELAIDLLWLDGNVVLHVVDAHSNF